MASSDDELASYDNSPRIGTSNQVAGPSKLSKRRSARAPAENVSEKPSLPNAIAISSDDEDALSNTNRQGKAATAHAPNGRPTTSKGKGKGKNSAGVPLKRRKVADGNGVSGVEETTAETDDDIGVSHRRVIKPTIGDPKGNNPGRLLERLQKQLKDVTQQRDRASEQLDELFRLRETEAEKLLVEQKEQYEARLKTQDDTILELQSSLSRVDTLSQPGGTTSLHFLTRETADEEKQSVQREVTKLKKTIKEKDMVIGEKDVEIKELSETIQVLRTDLKTEIENTKTLSSRNQPPSGSKNPKSGDPKLAMVIRLYEELTGILITNVRHESGQYKEDDAVYTCVQTTSNNKSLNFNLKFFREAEDGETPSSAKRIGQTIEKVIYTPQLLDQEPKEFVAQLDFLASPFTFQKEQMNVFMKTLTSYLEGEIELSDTSQMEVENN